MFAYSEFHTHSLSTSNAATRTSSLGRRPVSLISTMTDILSLFRRHLRRSNLWPAVFACVEISQKVHHPCRTVSGPICYGMVRRFPVHRHRASIRVLLLCCRLIFQVYDAKVVHFKTSWEYRRVEIVHFAVCNQGHDVSRLCTSSKSYAAAGAVIRDKRPAIRHEAVRRYPSVPA